MADAHREVAVVMFVDVCGFSELAQRDERLALELVDDLRATAAPLIDEFKGRLVKTIGDALMVEFRSALAAVGCATRLQQGLRARNEAKGSTKPLLVRVGIHMGDVVRQGEDILGDTVNIAARVEPKAEPGGIAVTEAVYQQVRSKSECPLVPLGSFSLKGIQGETPLYRVVLPWHTSPRRAIPVTKRRRWAPLLALSAAAIAAALAWMGWSGYHRSPSSVPMPVSAPESFSPPAGTLVVLPFRNESGDRTQQYFSDGITEELTDNLGRMQDLRVIAWDTASTFRDSKLSAIDIGRSLNVANILHGSILRQNDRVRVSAELVNTVTGYQLWSEHYDQPFKDIFTLEDSVSKSIVNALSMKLAGPTPAAGGTGDSRAHDLVLKARADLERFDVDDLQEAMTLLEQAIKIDPKYAEAHGLWAFGAGRLGILSGKADTNVHERVDREAYAALALDPRDENALVALGNDAVSQNDIAGALGYFRRALAIDPSNALAHLEYGTVLPLKQGLAEEQAAIALDPKNSVALYNLAGLQIDAGDYHGAIQSADAIMERDPKGVYAPFLLALAYQQLGELPRTTAAFDVVEPANEGDRLLRDAGRKTYQALSDPKLRPDALAAIARLRDSNPNDAQEGELPQLYLALGEGELALQMLGDICPKLPVACNDLAINPTYAPIRKDPRFKALTKKYNTASL